MQSIAKRVKETWSICKQPIEKPDYRTKNDCRKLFYTARGTKRKKQDDDHDATTCDDSELGDAKMRDGREGVRGFGMRGRIR